MVTRRKRSQCPRAKMSFLYCDRGVMVCKIMMLLMAVMVILGGQESVFAFQTSHSINSVSRISTNRYHPLFPSSSSSSSSAVISSTMARKVGMQTKSFRNIFGRNNYQMRRSTSLQAKLDLGVFTAPFRNAMDKFTSRPGTYLLIPVIAALVGWFTNWLAVQMIFYPVEYAGIPFWRRKNVPLGLIGWQGIVPCKTVPMSENMVTMVTTQLLSVQEVFKRLDPKVIADLLSPEIPILTKEIGQDIFPQW